MGSPSMEELIPIVLFISIAAVAIFRPLTKRIGLMIEQSYKDRQAAAPSAQSPQFERLAMLMERMIDRMDRLEDRVDFTERMLDSRPPQSPSADAPMIEEPETERSRRRG